MDMKTVCSCVLVLSLQFVCGQYSNTPCPGVFDFESDGQNVYGKITLQPVTPVTSLVLRINFTVAAQLFNNYVGRVDAQDSTNLLQRYNQGHPVMYVVHFPVTSPLPKLTSLTANGDTVCYGPGDTPRPNTYVTTLSLQHTSFLQGSGGIQTGGSPVYNNFQHLPQTRPRPVQPIQSTVNHIYYGDDIYTFDNVEPAWSSGNSAIYVVNDTGPFTQPTQQYQPPTQQVFHSKPIYEFVEPVFQVTTRRPVRPIIPVYEQPVTRRPTKPITTAYEPVTNKPVYEPAIESRPSQNDNSNLDQGTTASDQRYSNNADEMIDCGIVAGGNNRVPLIYNGDAYDRGEIPWLVAIYKSEQATLRFVCGGTLVSDRHVVTAAHCMQRRASTTSIKDIVVKVGVHNLNDWSDDITVTRTLSTAHLHEQYNPATLKNDILVITLDKQVTFNDYIRPACLWSGDTSLSRVVGKSGVVAGWGDQGVGGIGKQGEPHMVRVPIVSTNDCRASKSLFHELTHESTLCAGDRKGSGPCVGDSGGGMYLFDKGKWRVRGVVSVSLPSEDGERTCNLNEYVVFTDTAQFLPWIKNIISQT